MIQPSDPNPARLKSRLENCINGMSEPAAPALAPRLPVRPHVARVVDPAHVLMLDADGVMFDIRPASRRAISDASSRAISGALNRLMQHPRANLPPMLFAFDWNVNENLGFLAKFEPEVAQEASALVTALELEGLSTAPPHPALPGRLEACARTGRPVVAVSGLSRAAVRAAIDASGLSSRIAAVVARDGVDLTSVQPDPALTSTARSLGVPPEACLLVSGMLRQLAAANKAGLSTTGCACGRDRYAQLVWDWSPGVPNHARLVDALLHRA